MRSRRPYPIFRLALLALLSALVPARAALDAPVAPNAQPGVAQLLTFLNNTSGTAILAGQQEFPGWPDRVSEPGQDVDFDYIRTNTGKTPSVRGFDFLFYTHSPEGRAVQHSTERAIAWAKAGGIVTFSCHLFMQSGSPAGNPQFYVPGANGNATGTTVDIRQVVIAGTPENTEFLAKLDIIAAELAKLRDAGVVVIWRPFHECSGGWFWWGAHGGEPLKQAWRLMFDRFTRLRGLNNLIWCFNPTGADAALGSNLQNWYPGDDVVDMISNDVYPAAGTHPTFAADYQRMRDFRSGRKVVAMSENGAIPDIDQLFAAGAGWAYFCTWNGYESNIAQNSESFLHTVYNHAKVITLDELPARYVPWSVDRQPQSQRLVAGSALSLDILAHGTGTLSYQWYKDGTALPGATAVTYSIGNAALSAAGTYTVVVTGAESSLTSAPADVVVVAPGASPATLVNIASRVFSGTDNRVTIGGFVVSGSATKRLLLRAVGPTLIGQGIPRNEVMLDPTIEVHQMVNQIDTVVTTIDNWSDNTNVDEISSTTSLLGAAGLATDDAKSSAVLLNVRPGVYSFIAGGKDRTSGVALVEVYDADTSAPTARLVNISTRAYCATGNSVAIGGFVVSGNSPKRVLLRAVGPTLTTQGLGATEILQDPTIEVHDAPHDNVVIATNDDWGRNANAAEIVATGSRVGATPLAASDATSSALLLFLQPGVYSFVVNGKGSSSGVVLIEVYDAD